MIHRVLVSSPVHKLQDVGEKEVRDWLATTFTKQESVYEQPPFSKPPTFKTVVQAVIIGQHIDKYDVHILLTY